MLSVERWVLAPLRNRRFFSLVELNEAISVELEQLNDRQFRGEVTSRRELFNGKSSVNPSTPPALSGRE